MQATSKIFVAGHRGMVGSAVLRCLQRHGYGNLVTRSHAELDLTRQDAVEQFFAQEAPEYVFLAAARVGGILANQTYRAEFSYTNLQIQTNIIHSAWRRWGPQAAVLLQFMCVSPSLSSTDERGDCWTGELEPTNEPYAVAKLAGMSMCRAYREQYGADFISVVPTNLYGPHDDFDPEQSHLIAALLRKFHEAKIKGYDSVTLWGTGQPRREVLYVDDLAEAAVLLMLRYSEAEPVNIGWGQDDSIVEIAAAVKAAVGYGGELRFDATKPDGAPQKLLEVSRVRQLGWKPTVSLPEGLARTYSWYLSNGT